jgi:murein DD-endopeptidase MepM/ murein hydrolase activator NlpD
MRTTLRPVAIVVCLALALAGFGGATAGGSEDQGLAATRAEKARRQAELEAAVATDQELEARIDRLRSEMAEQSAVAARSEAEAEAARQNAEEARRKAEETQKALDAVRERLRRRARMAYKAPSPGLLDALLSSHSLSEAGLKLYGISRLIDSDNTLIEELSALEKDLQEDRAFFEAEIERAKAAKQAAERARNRLAELKATSEATEKALSERIEHLKAEVEALAKEEARIRAIIAARQSRAEAALAGGSRQGGKPDAGRGGNADSSGRGGATGTTSSAPASPGGGGRPRPGRLLWPVPGTVTSGFGMRWGRLHAGIDIAAPEGTPVRAADSGVVIFAGWAGGYGNLVLVAHGGGMVTAYAHLSSVAVGEGASVGRGSTIGAVGSTGHSTGPHLHFEVRINGQPQDPMAYL